MIDGSSDVCSELEEVILLSVSEVLGECAGVEMSLALGGFGFVKEVAGMFRHFVRIKEFADPLCNVFS